MSQLTKQQLQVENNTNFPNNNTGYISPFIPAISPYTNLFFLTSQLTRAPNI